MAIYERKVIRKHRDARGKDVSHVSAFFRRPEPGETAQEMREKKRRYPVHIEDIERAGRREKEEREIARE